MTSRRYLNFDLLLEQEGEGRYQARVTDSPLGESPSVRFQLPFDATTLENLLLKLDPGRSGTRRVGATGQQQAAMDFGGPLYDAVFTGDLALAWQRSLDRARADDAGGLRLRLRLKDAPAIAGLPWELLYDAKGNSFLAQSERTPVVRFLDVPQVPRPMTVDGPLRILAIISSPIDLEELDVEAEWRRIGDALRQRIEAGLVVLDRLPSATLGELGDWLRQHETHVIHFVGHGDFDARLREGVVYFQDNHGKSSPVTSSVLGPFLRDHNPLRMVVLNACRSARSDAVDPFAGMAQGLVQQDATAVVAMQFPISDRAAVTFTGEFYGALVDGLPVDQAVSSARKALLAEFRDEWSTPVLFMRSPDGDIFENVHAQGAVVPVVDDDDDDDDDVPKPGPSWWKTAVLFVNRNRKLAMGAAAAVVALVVGLVVVAVLQDGGNDDEDPVALPPSQLLVAAGTSKKDLDIYVFDVPSRHVGARLVHSESNDTNPVLSPTRQTMIFAKDRGGGAGNQLRISLVAPGSDDRPLFDENSVKECSSSTGRPAWIPGSETLVMRCFGSDGFVRIVSVDIVNGNAVTYAKISPEDKDHDFGHPAVSPDGNTVVYPLADARKAREGTLFSVDPVKHDEVELLAPEGEFKAFGDPVFSPNGDKLAWRATLVVPLGTDPRTVLSSVVLVAPFVDGELRIQEVVQISDSDAVGTDQEPMFSPDGTQIVYTHSPPDNPDTTDVAEPDFARELWIAPVDNPDDRSKLSDDTHPYFAAPAWSRR